MRRFALMILAAALLACGGSDTADENAADENATGADAGQKMGETAPVPPPRPTGAVAGEAPPPNAALSASTCRKLIAVGNFEMALKICLQALEADPDNTELQDAVATARAELGDAVSAAGDMMDSAAGAAGDMADPAAAEAQGMADDAAAAADELSADAAAAANEATTGAEGMKDDAASALP